MRERRISTTALKSGSKSEEEWLDMEAASAVEVTSEDPNFLIESALAGRSPGWRAAEAGEQVIRLLFDQPMPLQRIRLEFSEAETERTQEFTLRWAREGEPPRGIVRGNGTSARAAQQGKSKTIGSTWIASRCSS
jgi:hypothetical protein